MSENKILSRLRDMFTGKKKKSIEPETPAEASARSAEDAVQPNAELQGESTEPEKAPSERHIPSGDAADAPQATEGVPLSDNEPESLLVDGSSLQADTYSLDG